jgi:hypothetical protein
MKHILFPTVDAADAFIADLQSRGVVQPEMGQMTVNRRQAGGMAGQMGTGTTTGMGSSAGTDSLVGASRLDSVENSGVNRADAYLEGGTAEDAGAGAVKGTVAGAIAGAVSAVVGTAVTIGTGGLALPVVLGLTALGSGVGAAVGAAGGAAGVDETGDGTRMAGTGSIGSRYPDSAEMDEEQYGRLHSGMNSGGRAVAVDDNVPQDVLNDVVRAHGGQFV